MSLMRVSRFLELLEQELAGFPDLHADLLALAQFEPQELLPWLAVLDVAEAKLGDLETVAKWLTCPHAALNGMLPVSLVGTDDGTTRVRELLAQYEPLPPWRSAK